MAPETTEGGHTAVERLAAAVAGRVQGVGFRYFVLDEAARLRLRGYTRNLSDGRTVEVVAEGRRVDLEALLAALGRGPPGAHVEGVQADWQAATDEFGGFSIRR
jgi:acylphosphatase